MKFTNSSQKLYLLGQEISESLKGNEIKEITLSGSVSRNLADKYSDLELDFWCEEIPTHERKTKLLSLIGAKNIVNNDANDDSSEDSEFLYKDQLVEITWQTYTNIKQLISEVYSLKTTNHDAFVYMWTIQYQKNLKSIGEIDKIKDKVINEYPKGLKELLISKTIKEEIRIPSSRLADIERNELFSLNLKLIEQTKSILRMLYALNERWEVYWKWIFHMIDLELNIKPKNLSKRINEMLLDFSNPRKALIDNFKLYIKTLELIGENQSNLESELIQKKIGSINEQIEIISKN